MNRESRRCENRGGLRIIEGGGVGLLSPGWHLLWAASCGETVVGHAEMNGHYQLYTGSAGDNFHAYSINYVCTLWMPEMVVFRCLEAGCDQKYAGVTRRNSYCLTTSYAVSRAATCNFINHSPIRLNVVRHTKYAISRSHRGKRSNAVHSYHCYSHSVWRDNGVFLCWLRKKYRKKKEKKKRWIFCAPNLRLACNWRRAFHIIKKNETTIYWSIGGSLAPSAVWLSLCDASLKGAFFLFSLCIGKSEGYK